MPVCAGGAHLLAALIPRPAAAPPAQPFRSAAPERVRQVRGAPPGEAHTATMGRMHTPGKGLSSSALPYKRSPPSWLKTTAAEVRARRQCTRVG